MVAERMNKWLAKPDLLWSSSPRHLQVRIRSPEGLQDHGASLPEKHLRFRAERDSVGACYTLEAPNDGECGGWGGHARARE